MGGCGMTPHNIVVEVDEHCSVNVGSSKRVHDLRLAVAEQKKIAPHEVEVCSMLPNKKLLGHNEPLSRWNNRRGRLSVILKQPTMVFFTASLDCTAKQHDATSGKCLATYVHPKPVNALCISNCGCFVYTACEDGICRKFDDIEATVAKSYHAKTCALVHVALSPSGDSVYTCTRSNVAQKFDEASGQLLCVFFEHVSGNPTLTLSSCGTYIYKTTSNHVARKYNWQTGEVLATYGRDECSVLGVALGHDQDKHTTLVFVACSDGTVKQFDENGVCLRSYAVHADKVTWIGAR